MPGLKKCNQTDITRKENYGLISFVNIDILLLTKILAN